MGRKRNFPAELIAQLGKKSDPQLAADFGLKPSVVASARIHRGIPAFNLQQKWTDEHVALLGTMTDREVATRTGRGKAAVTFARQSRGIAGCDHLGNPPAGRCAQCGGFARYPSGACKTCNDARSKAAYYAKHPNAVPRPKRTPEERRLRRNERQRRAYAENKAAGGSRPQ